MCASTAAATVLLFAVQVLLDAAQLLCRTAFDRICGLNPCALCCRLGDNQRAFDNLGASLLHDPRNPRTLLAVGSIIQVCTLVLRRASTRTLEQCQLCPPTSAAHAALPTASNDSMLSTLTGVSGVLNRPLPHMWGMHAAVHTLPWSDLRQPATRMPAHPCQAFPAALAAAGSSRHGCCIGEIQGGSSSVPNQPTAVEQHWHVLLWKTGMSTSHCRQQT